MQPSLNWKVGITVAHCMAIFVTLYRVSHRKQTRGLWWDDHFAVLALVLDIVAFVFTWVDSPMGLTQNATLRIATVWLVNLIYILIMWPARISLTLSISRILTPSEPFFKYTILSAFLFGLFMAAGVIMVTVVCGQNTSWYYAPPFQCIIPRSLGFYFISSHVVADTILIALPLRIFWHVRLPLIEKNVILVGFAASAITTTASIVFTVVLMSNNMSRAEKARLAPVLIELLATISLIVCNFLVVITRLYRLYQKLSHYLARRKLEKGPILSSSLPTSTIVLTEISDFFDPESISRVTDRRFCPNPVNLTRESSSARVA